MESGLRGRFGGAPYLVGPESMGWAMVGASRIAAVQMLAALRALPPRIDGSVQAWVVGVQSHAPHRAQSFAERNAIAHWESDLEALLARPSVRCVYIANHPRHHAGSVLAALRAGKHVLCEPPLALAPEESAYLHRFAADRRLTLAAHYQHRTDPALLLLRDWIAGHELGDIVGGAVRSAFLLPIAQQGWRVDAAWGGVIIDRTLRTVDAVRFLCGDEVAGVAAMAGPDVLGHEQRRSATPAAAPAVEDLHALLSLRRSGAVFSTYDSFLVPHLPPRIDVYGSRSSVTILPWEGLAPSRLYLYRSGGLEEVTLHAPDLNLWSLSLVAFHEAVRIGAPPPGVPSDDLANLRLCHALIDAIAASGAQIPAPAPAPGAERT